MATERITKGWLGPFTPPQAARIAGLQYYQVDYLARTGLVVPSVQDSAGRGTWRRYSFRDVVALRTVASLRRGGVTVQSLRRVSQYLRTVRGLNAPLADARLLIVGNDVVMKQADELESVLRRPGQGMFQVINITQVTREVKAAAEAIMAAA